MFILVSHWKLNLLLVFLLMTSALLEILRLFISSQWVYLLHTLLPFFGRILNLYVFSQSSLAFSSLRLKIHVCGFSQEYTVAAVLNRLTSHLQKFALVALETHSGKWSEWHVCERGSRTEDAHGPLGDLQVRISRSSQEVLGWLVGLPSFLRSQRVLFIVPQTTPCHSVSRNISVFWMGEKQSLGHFGRILWKWGSQVPTHMLSLYPVPEITGRNVILATEWYSLGRSWG